MWSLGLNHRCTKCNQWCLSRWVCLLVDKYWLWTFNKQAARIVSGSISRLAESYPFLKLVLVAWSRTGLSACRAQNLLLKAAVALFTIQYRLFGRKPLSTRSHVLQIWKKMFHRCKCKLSLTVLFRPNLSFQMTSCLGWYLEVWASAESRFQQNLGKLQWSKYWKRVV